MTQKEMLIHLLKAANLNSNCVETNIDGFEFGEYSLAKNGNEWFFLQSSWGDSWTLAHSKDFTHCVIEGLGEIHMGFLRSKVAELIPLEAGES